MTALLVTVSMGTVLRWSLAGVSFVNLDFGHMRHAHGHLGYYEVLFPLTWLLLYSRRGALALEPGLAWLYGLSTVVATVGFLNSGYGLIAIVGSAIVGALWFVAAFGRGVYIIIGTGLAEACGLPIALYTRTAPNLAQTWVASFLAALLLLVIVPSVLDLRDVRVSKPTLLISGIIGALFLGAYPSPILGLGLAAYGLVLIPAIASSALPRFLQVAWWTLCIGLFGLASGLLPSQRSIVIGAIHFLVLGPVILSLVEPLLRQVVNPWGWWLGLLSVTGLTVPLVWHGLTGEPQALFLSAWGGSGVASWWIILLVRECKTRLGSEAVRA